MNTSAPPYPSCTPKMLTRSSKDSWLGWLPLSSSYKFKIAADLSSILIRHPCIDDFPKACRWSCPSWESWSNENKLKCHFDLEDVPSQTLLSIGIDVYIPIPASFRNIVISSIRREVFQLVRYFSKALKWRKWLWNKKSFGKVMRNFWKFQYS